ncbi:MAG: GNAT family N-acetyltransferase [Candidatus Baltobacteraceae bacterium]
MIRKDLVLENEHVRLEPLEPRHASDLFEAGNDIEVWRKAGRSNQMSSLAATFEYVDDALHGQIGGVPFAIIEKQSAKAIGSTRYFEISEHDGKLEIGWTWIGRKHWRTRINSSCKFLLLEYAFETAGVQRVQLKADAANDRSRAAILRLGATYEGTLRNFRVIEGALRSVSYYSILRDEWPSVRARLEIESTVQTG